MLESWEAFTSSIRRMESTMIPLKKTQGKVGDTDGGGDAL